MSNMSYSKVFLSSLLTSIRAENANFYDFFICSANNAKREWPRKNFMKKEEIKLGKRPLPRFGKLFRNSTRPNDPLSSRNEDKLEIQMAGNI